MTEYLKIGDPGCWDDFPTPEEKLALVKKYSNSLGEIVAVCPVCRGYGGWNLKLSSSPTRSHFRQSCFQCNGWGYVFNQQDAECVHVFDEGVRGRYPCSTIYTCTLCNQKREVDSSD
jgi:hypothetical protein